MGAPLPRRSGNPPCPPPSRSPPVQAQFLNVKVLPLDSSRPFSVDRAMESSSNRSTPFTPETVSRCRATRVMRWPPVPQAAASLPWPYQSRPFCPCMGLAYLYAGRGRSSTEGGHFPAPVVGAFTNLGAAAPRGGPPARRGVPHFSREMGEKEGRGSAPGPRFFHSRSFPLAGFAVVISATVEGLFPPVC